MLVLHDDNGVLQALLLDRIAVDGEMGRVEDRQMAVRVCALQRSEFDTEMFVWKCVRVDIYVHIHIYICE